MTPSALEMFDESALWCVSGLVHWFGSLVEGTVYMLDGPTIGSIAILENAVGPLESRRIDGAVRDTEGL